MARKRKRSRSEHSSDIKSKRCRLFGMKTSHENVVKHSILTQYYPRVLTLGEYLCSRLPFNSKSRRKRIRGFESGCESLYGADNEGRYVSLGNFLASTLVGVLDEDGQRKDDRWAQWTSYSQLADCSSSTLRTWDRVEEWSQLETVDFTVWLLFKTSFQLGSRAQHLLCQGYRKNAIIHAINHNENPTSAIPGLISAYPNRNVTGMKSFPWPQILLLLGREGHRVMIDLILDCGIFVALEIGQGNYNQLSGKPLSDLPTLIPKIGMPNSTEPLRSHLPPTTINMLGSQQSDVVNTPGTIMLVRNRMLYARAALNSRGGVRFGLSHIHVLNRYPHKLRDHASNSPSDARELKNNDQDGGSRKVLQSTIHVIMYIFPRQFGLHNVFTSTVDQRETVQPLKDYTVREDEIACKHGPLKPKSEIIARCKVPKRLRGSIIELIQRLRINHSRCPYQKLLMHYCPTDDGRIATAMLPIDPIATDESTSFKTQVSVRPLNTSMFSDGRPSSIITALRKTTLMDYATPMANVSAFCCAVLARLIPDEFWGVDELQAHNKFLLVNSVYRFISLRRFETLSLHNVLQGMKIHRIPWLAPPNHATGRTSQTDAFKRLQLFHEFLYYVFDSILVPLIRGHFYVTESNAHRHRLFYFRHDTWRSLAEPSLASLKLSMLTEVKVDDAQTILKARSIGYSQLRLLPKETGVRPIMNLRRRTVKGGYKNILGSSINSVMAPVFNMLTFEKNRNPGRLGSTIASIGDLHSRLRSFSSQLGNKSAPLFFVKVDVQSAFDSIPQSAVLQLMTTIPRESEYRIWKHVEIKPGEGYRLDIEGDSKTKPIRKWVSRAVSLGDFQSYSQSLVTNLAVDKKNTLFVESIVNQIRQREELVGLLAQHVQCNMVKIGKKFYRQKQGIPQGSVLSSLLCNYFYGDLEANHLAFLNSNESLLLRLIDDFLLITTNRDHARQFLQVMHDGLPEYGVTVNPAKTLVNFEVCINKMKVARLLGSRQFPYCGNFIDTKTLNVSKDCERRKDFSITDALTVEFSRTPGKMFHRRILNAFKIKAYTIFFDTTFNTLGTVFSNIYDNFIEAATKMWRYAKCLPLKKQPSVALILRTISDLVNLAFVFLKGKGRSKKNCEYRCAVTRMQIEWLAITAFNSVLQRRQGRFRDVIAWIESRIAALRSKKAKDCMKLTHIVHAKTGREEYL